MKLLATKTSAVLLAAGIISAMSGCGGGDGIESYSVARQSVINREHGVEGKSRRLPAAGPARTLAAIVSQGDDGWFFKLTGPPEAVAPHEAEFNAFVKSIHFSAAGKPQWKLPPEWSEEPSSGMRYATILVNVDEEDEARQRLELSVIKLPRNEPDETAFVLANVNRWRDQLSLPPIAAKDLKQETRHVKLDGATAIVVDLTGTSKPGGMSGAPFAGGGPMSRSPQAVEPAPTGKLTYKTPEGWQEGAAGGMRKAAFEVRQGDRRIEITVIDLDAAAGDVLANVNRWRGQLKLSPVDAAELAKDLKEVRLGNAAGKQVELESPAGAEPRQALLGVIAEHGGRAWFIKLMGDAELAEREKPRFAEFVRSIELP